MVPFHEKQATLIRHELSAAGATQGHEIQVRSRAGFALIGPRGGPSGNSLVPRQAIPIHSRLGPVGVVLVDVGPQLPGGAVQVHDNYGYSAPQRLARAPDARRGACQPALLPGDAGHSSACSRQFRQFRAADCPGHRARSPTPANGTTAPGHWLTTTSAQCTTHLRPLLPFAGIGACSVAVIQWVWARRLLPFTCSLSFWAVCF